MYNLDSGKTTDGYEKQSFRYGINSHGRVKKSPPSDLISELINTTALKAIQDKDVKKVNKWIIDLKKHYTQFISLDSRSDFLKNIPNLKDGSTLLHEAVKEIRKDNNVKDGKRDSLDIVKILIQHGANVNARNGFLQTPLIIAIEGLMLSSEPLMFRIHEELISLLEKAGATINIEDEEVQEDSSRVRILAAQGDPSVSGDSSGQNLHHVLWATAYFGTTAAPRLMEAVVSGDVAATSEALDSGEEDPSAKIIPSMWTALHLATWMNHFEVVELLLGAEGVDPDIADRFGLTPLVMAAAMGHESCLVSLLKAGAKLNRVVLASDLARIKCPSLRVDYLINMPYPICPGTTALHEAVKSNNPKCVEALLECGAEADAKDSLGNTPLLIAGAILRKDDKLSAISQYASVCNGEHPPATAPIVMSFPDYAASTSNASFDSERSPEVVGASVGQEQGEATAVSVRNYEAISSMLIDCTTDIDHCNDVSSSALMNAVFLGSEKVAGMLLAKGADPSVKNKYGSTPVHEAAARGRVNLLRRFIDRVLLKKIPSPQENDVLNMINSTDANGSTPVHRAAYGGHDACVSFLIKAGANLSLRNDNHISGIEAILVHLHRSRSFLTSLLDSQLKRKKAPKWKGDYVLEIDFDVLLPNGAARQTDVTNSLLSSSVLPKGIQRDILEHPLVEAFYRLKWRKARVSFFVVIAIHLVFVVVLSSFVTLEYIQFSRENSILRVANVLRYVHLPFAVLVLVHAMGLCFLNFHYYIWKFETWILGMSALLSILWALTGLESSPQFLSDASDWGKVSLSFILPLAWTALMLMIGRFREWGSRALLFGVVLRNVLLTFVVLGLLIIGLSLSFFIMFNTSKPDDFGDPLKSFISTVVMMTGEYNYSDTFKNTSFYDRILFLIFVIVATLVIMNLVIALAVTDAQSLSTVGDWLCLKKKMEFTHALEAAVPRMVARCCLARKMKFTVRGSEDSGYDIMDDAIPSRLADALMDAALRHQMEKPSSNKTAGDVVITFPEGDDCSLELHIVDAEENRVKDILRLLYSRVGGSIKEFVHSSKGFPSLGSKVFWVKRVAKKFRNK